jgi:hypothetical protein
MAYHKCSRLEGSHGGSYEELYLLRYFMTLKMKAIYSSGTLVD